MASKIRKGWTEEPAFQHYTRKFGPMLLSVNWAYSEGFSARLIIDGKACLHEFGPRPAVEDDDDFNNATLDGFEKEAKLIIRDWAK